MRLKIINELFFKGSREETILEIRTRFMRHARGRWTKLKVGFGKIF